MTKVYEAIDFPKFFKPEPLRLNLQFFADGGEGGSEGVDGGTEGNVAGTGAEGSTPLTVEEINKMIELGVQSNTDKLRTKYDKELKAAQAKVKELETANLSEQEKFELAKQELAEKNAKLLERENIIFASKALTDAELDPSFLDFVRAGDDEGTTAKVQALKTAYDKAVAAGIEAHIKGTGRSYTKGSGGGSTTTSEGAEFAQNLNNQTAPTGPSLWGN